MDEDICKCVAHQRLTSRIKKSIFSMEGNNSMEQWQEISVGSSQVHLNVQQMYENLFNFISKQRNTN